MTANVKSLNVSTHFYKLKTKSANPRQRHSTGDTCANDNMPEGVERSEFNVKSDLSLEYGTERTG